MPLIAQICLVLVTIAVVGFVAMAIRTMLQTRLLLETATRSLAELPALIEDAKRTAERADQLLAAFSRITASAEAGVQQFEGIATRSNALATQVLDEIGRPVGTAVSLIRGIRVGANFLAKRWQSVASSGSQPQQGDDHVGAQRWRADGRVHSGSGRRSGVGLDSGTNGG